jgi:hypothetical protein
MQNYSVYDINANTWQTVVAGTPTLAAMQAAALDAGVITLCEMIEAFESKVETDKYYAIVYPFYAAIPQGQN